MVVEETFRRDKFRAEVPLLSEMLVEEDCSEDQYQCCICKAFCYLSQITCTCTKKASCIDHADQLCGCPSSKRTLRKRYSENQLEEILSVIEARANQPEVWRDRFRTLLGVSRPALKSMRALLADGERISHSLPEIEDLRALVIRANAWVERVTALATRKSTGRRRKGRQDEPDDDLDRSPDVLSGLLKEADRMAFDAPEILQLRQMVYNIDGFRSEASIILSTPESELDIDKCRTALILGNSLNVDLEELAELQTIVNRLEWFRKVEEEVDDRMLQYEDVVRLLAEADDFGIPGDHATVAELRKREAKGSAWKQAVDKLLNAPHITVEEVSALVDEQELTPTIVDLMRQLENIRKTALGWQTSARQQLASGSANGAQRLCKAVKSASGSLSRIRIAEISQLQDELDFHAKWLEQLSAILGVPPNKVNAFLTTTLDSAKRLLSPADDRPSADFTCFCRTAPAPIMTTCSICKGQYHPRCVNVTAKNALHPIRCAMCERDVFDDRPSLNAAAHFVDAHKWNFTLSSSEMKLLNEIVDSALRFARFVLQLVDPLEQAIPCRDVELLTHCTRKLYNLPLVFDAVHTQTNERVVFEHWLRKRIQDARNQPKGRQRSRKAKLVLKQSHEHEFHCICRSTPEDHLIRVQCSRCGQGYHSSCVSAPIAASVQDGEKWRCPCCIVKEGKHSKGLDVRVQMSGRLIFVPPGHC